VGSPALTLGRAAHVRFSAEFLWGAVVHMLTKALVEVPEGVYLRMIGERILLCSAPYAPEKLLPAPARTCS
jgi:hypothetical protein